MFAMPTDMPVTVLNLMPIPKNALGQDVYVPIATTYANANHFWTYEKFAYHPGQNPLKKS